MELATTRLSDYKIFQEVVDRFSASMRSLQHHASERQLEKWAMLVLDGMSGPSRVFHSPEHILTLTEGMDPLAVLAGLYHDVVYFQIDGGLAPTIEIKIERYFHIVNGVIFISEVQDDELFDIVLGVFDFRKGRKLLPQEGQNEFLSALVAMVDLSPFLTRTELVLVAACIEATIPFRQDKNSFATLGTRMERVGQRLQISLSNEDIDAGVKRAVLLANKDVENFSFENPADFLSNTWKIIPEINMRMPSSLFTVREYRISVQKMDRFLSFLKPETVFHEFNGVPLATEFDRLKGNVAANLTIGARYLQITIYTAVLIEAIAEATGGDIPMMYFLGNMGPTKAVSPMADCDPNVIALLETKNLDSTIVVSPAPISAFLYKSLGNARMDEGIAAALDFIKGDLSSADFLRQQDTALVRAITEAVARSATTRRAALLDMEKWYHE